MLKNMDEIKSNLKSKFAGSGMDELILRDSTLTPLRVSELEANLDRSLPDAFKRLILKYDFGHLDWRVFFGTGGDYDEWLLKNNGQGVSPSWWGLGDRPSDFLYVAATDAYVVILSLEDGGVCTFLRDDNWRNHTLVAKDFELFARGTGTMLLKDDDADEQVLAHEVRAAVGADPQSSFWGGY